MPRQIPIERNSHDKSVHLRIATSQSVSSRFDKSAAIAKANGIVIEIKKAATSDTTPATYGRSSRWWRGVSTSASDPNTDNTVAQKSRLPFWPAYSADQV